MNITESNGSAEGMAKGVGGGSWNGKAKIAANAHPPSTLSDFGEGVGVVVKWNGLGGTLKRGRNPYQRERIQRKRCFPFLWPDLRRCRRCPLIH